MSTLTEGLDFTGRRPIRLRVSQPDLWFIDDLVQCAGKVLARSGNGDLVFVGRSLDSTSDLLSGALADIPTEDADHRDRCAGRVLAAHRRSVA